MGGDTKSIVGMCELFNGKIDYQVITSNLDSYGDKLDREDYEPKVIYKEKKITLSFLSDFKNANLIWFNSLYSIPFGFVPLFSLFLLKKTTILLSPRGQLLKGAISTKKNFYLKVFKSLLSLTGHKVIIHYSHKKEQEQSYPVFKNFKSIIFPNPLSENFQKEAVPPTNTKKHIIAFFGRVAPIKNIEFLIDLLPALNKNIELQIHGLRINEKYNRILFKKMESLNLSKRVTFVGAYNKSDFKAKVKEVDVIVIPSHSENFCHVFFEAIEGGKLLIASDGLPWGNVNDFVNNTILPLDKNEWIDRIEAILALTNQEYKNEYSKLVDFSELIKKSVNKEIECSFNELLKINLSFDKI